MTGLRSLQELSDREQNNTNQKEFEASSGKPEQLTSYRCLYRTVMRQIVRTEYWRFDRESYRCSVQTNPDPNCVCIAYPDWKPIRIQSIRPAAHGHGTYLSPHRSDRSEGEPEVQIGSEAGRI